MAVSAAADIGGGTHRRGSAGWASTAAGPAARAAAPAAAPFRKFRRSISGFFCLDIPLYLPTFRFARYITHDKLTAIIISAPRENHPDAIKEKTSNCFCCQKLRGESGRNDGGFKQSKRRVAASPLLFRNTV